MLLTTCIFFFLSFLFPLVAEPSIQSTSLQRNSNVLSTLGAGVPLWMAEKVALYSETHRCKCYKQTKKLDGLQSSQ